MNGTMGVCLSFKKMVWAYDANLGDVRGILNMMKIPCRWRTEPFDEHLHYAHVLRLGKKAAGALLDGRAWREMPAVRQPR